MFIASATASADELSYHEVNNSDAEPKRPVQRDYRSRFHALSSNQEALNRGDVRQRVARRSGRRHRGGRTPAASCRRTAGTAWPPTALADMGRTRCAASIHRPRRQFAVGTPGSGRESGTRRPSRRHQYRHGVREIAGLPTAHPHCAGGRSARPCVVHLADQSPWPRPTAGRILAVRGRSPAGRCRADSLRRRQRRRGPPVRPRALALGLLQPRHGPPGAAAQPCPLGHVPAEPSIRRGRRMPLLPRQFSARTWRWCCGVCCGCARDTRPTRPRCRR